MQYEKSLAPNNRFYKIATPAIVLACSIGLAIQFRNNESLTLTIFIVTVMLISIALIARAYYKSYDLFYDETSLYLKGLDAVQSIPLTRIKRMTSGSSRLRVLGVAFDQYQIAYCDDYNNACQIQFWKLPGSQDAANFATMVKKENPYFWVDI